MLFMLWGCVPTTDPSLGPEIEDFYLDPSSLENVVDSEPEDGENEDTAAQAPDPNEPVESELLLDVQQKTLFVTHTNVELPCEAEMAPNLSITDTTLTMIYTEDTSDDCLELFSGSYSIILDSLAAGDYLFVAHGDEAGFTLE